MILRDSYMKYDDRCFSHRGVVIDIGCLDWNWSRDFFGKKRVIGFDINEKTCPAGSELRKNLVLPMVRKCSTYGTGGALSVMYKSGEMNCGLHESVSLESVLKEFEIMPSILKINAEGSEYPLLFSLKEPPSDQLIVSFHDFDAQQFPYPKSLSNTVMDYLSFWYNWQMTNRRYSWWIGMLKDEFRV